MTLGTNLALVAIFFNGSYGSHLEIQNGRHEKHFF
jgi:hypothetical protein